MNPDLDRLHAYPFQKLAALLAGITPSADVRAINLGIGEPRHATPQFIRDALSANLAGLANYPATLGSEALREAIAAWIARRYNVTLDPHNQIIPVNGSREALFAFAQAAIDRAQSDPIVVLPNPFYQIYEGAAILAGASPFYVNAVAHKDFAFDVREVPGEVWRRTQLLYVCSPDNPTGRVLQTAEWQALFELADRHDFVIASDECYSEIYFDEANPPLGALQAAMRCGRPNLSRLVVFSSLSKRSNVPGMRSGFVAGDAALLKRFALYRTYHGGAMGPAIQAASIAAWRDDAHVTENRRLYREKFEATLPLLKSSLRVGMPQAGFYFWAGTPLADDRFARELYRHYNVTVLPGSFLAREAHGVNPGADYVRIALVVPLADCVEAAQRIANCCANV